ncbi:MAG TPA: MMPL family transporter [Gallionella sp.]|nr:MMPL family transporter [Gallionella sp.]
MKRINQRWPIAAWLIFLAFCIFLVSRIQIGADINAFLPSAPTPAQRLLTEQLRDGIVSRLILAGVEGGTPETLAKASKNLANRLHNEPAFSMANNGEESSLDKDRAYIFDNRYLLSSAVTPGHFTPEALHGSLERALQLLGSPAGVMIKSIIPRDPSGELLHLLEGFTGQSRPPMQEGVWMSRDGKRALLVLQTEAAGYDIDAQQQAIQLIHKHFAESTQGPEFSGLHIQLTGPGVFSVESRNHVESVALNFSIITAILVSILLLLVYRSWRVLAISLLPVISGALTGIAAVSMGYGVVFGVTLGFGITLIGEAVDYAIYFFTHLSPEKPPGKALENIWPTLRLGVLTTICGFSPMFLADFPGLAQLGLFSAVGLIVAVLVTRWVLPGLVPVNFSPDTPTRLAVWIMALIKQAPRLRPLVLIAVIAAVLSIALHRDPVWSGSLSSLFPISEAKQQLDQSLRNDLGAPDVRYLIAINGKNTEEALELSEAVGSQLDLLVNKQALAGYDSPARYLPSQKTQQARQAALPDEVQLRAYLKQALAGLPFRSDLFEPFLKEAVAARSQPLLTSASLKGTNLGLQTESLLAHYDDRWKALLPLRGVTDASSIRDVLSRLGGNIVLLDLKQESDSLYQSYVSEAVTLSAFGALAITVLLFFSLRSVRRVAAVLLPLAAAVIIATAIVLTSGQKLLIFHLVGLLLAVAVGSNYSLFFDRESNADMHEADSKRTMVSLLVANISTIIGFGMLSFSGVPVLTAIGETVAIGAFLSLLFSAVLMGRKIS